MQPGEDKPVSFSFPKKERLCSRLQLEQLLSLKQSVFSYPLKCYFQLLPLSEENPVSKMAVSVPKKLEKTAVGRNKIKRWVREAYRLNKHLLNNDLSEKRFSYSATIPSSCNPANMRVLVYIEKKFGSAPRIQTKDYGDYYVDNCATVELGNPLPLALVGGSGGSGGGGGNGGGNEEIIPGSEIK